MRIYLTSLLQEEVVETLEIEKTGVVVRTIGVTEIVTVSTTEREVGPVTLDPEVVAVDAVVDAVADAVADAMVADVMVAAMEALAEAADAAAAESQDSIVIIDLQKDQVVAVGVAEITREHLVTTTIVTDLSE